MMGIVISDSPQRVNDAHAHGANSRQQAADNAHNECKPKAKRQKRLGKDKRRQETGKSQADNRDGQVGEGQTEQAASESNGDGLREYKEKNSAPGEADGLENGKLANSFANGNGHGVAGNQQKCKENNTADGED